MIPLKRQFDFYLDDILTSMLRIKEYIEGKEFSDFKKNYMIIDAVVRNFEIIGEASKNIPASFKKKYPEIPWKKMYGLTLKYLQVQVNITGIKCFKQGLHFLSFGAGYPQFSRLWIVGKIR